MKIGHMSGAFDHYPLTEVIPRLAALGYQGVELCAEVAPWRKPHVTPQLGPKERAAIRQLAQDHGLEISAIAAHISLVDADRRTRQRHVDYVKGCIDLALDVGTNVVIGLTGAPPDGVPREKAWGWLLENIAACTRYAAERGIRFGIEAVGFCLVATMADLNQLLDDLKEEKLYVNFDPSHLPVVGEDPAEWVRTLGSRIVHIHVKDARIRGPDEEKMLFMGVPLDFECPPLGKGVIRFGEMVGALREIGYQGFLSVEYAAHVFGYPGDLWEAAAQSKRFMDDLCPNSGSDLQQHSMTE